MIFKFDKGGNMENIVTEGDNDMGRKSNKDRFNQMDVDVVNQVKEEVLGMVNETSSQVAVGYQEAMDENDEDMVQQHETELVKEMDAEVDDEKLKQQMRELNMRNMPSLSNLTKMKDEGEGKEDKEDSGEEVGVGSDKEQMVKGELNETRNELEVKREEDKKKRELKEINKLKRDMRSKLKQLDDVEDKSWKLNNVQIVLRDNKPYKYLVSMSCMKLAEWYVSKKLIYDPNVQRGSSINKKGEEVPILFLKHCREILSAILDGSIHGGNLSLNFPSDNNAEIFYNDEEMTLSADGPLTINDGFHRIYASYLWYKEFVKPNSTCKSPETFYFPVNIENLSKQASCDLFKEYAVMGKSISKNRISVHDVFSKDYDIAQRILKESQLRGRVEMISNSIKKTSSNIFTYGTILNGISEMKPVGDFLIEFLDYMIELFPTLMGNVEPEFRALEKQKSFVLEKMFQNSYFVLASKLYGRDDWKDKLGKLTLGNFLSRSNTQFSFCLRDEDKIINSSKIQKDITRIICERVLTS